MMRYARIRKADVSNGEGIGASIFFQGCSFFCKGCQNISIWSFKGGEEFTDKVERGFIRLCKHKYINHVSLLGGEPLQQPPQELLRFLKRVKEEVDKPIWLWTGYIYADIPKEYLPCLKYIDILVDGRYIEEEKDLTLKWRGSKNQRVIDVKESLKSKKVVEYNV